jgi:hypothetical protein
MTLTDSDILEIRLRMEVLICKREAMMARNTQRTSAGFPIIYSSDDFFDIGRKFGELCALQVNLIEGTI